MHEALLWHPARLSNLQMRVWWLVASGFEDVGTIAERAGARRASVSRALTALCAQGLLRRADAQDRATDGRYGALTCEALVPPAPVPQAPAPGAAIRDKQEPA